MGVQHISQQSHVELLWDVLSLLVFRGLANEGIAPIILYPYHWYVIVDVHAAILIPQQILNGQPTNTLQEGALALPNVDCGVERFADILNQIRTNDCVGTSQHIQFNLQTSA